MMVLDNFSKSRFSRPFYNSKCLVNSTRDTRDTILDFFENCGKNQSVETAIGGFAELLGKPLLQRGFPGQKALVELIESKDENAFRLAIKKAFFMVFNTLEDTQKILFVQEFVKLFSESMQKCNFAAPGGNRFKAWLNNFVQSEDYQEIELFAPQDTKSTLPLDSANWTQHYAIYLLVSQSMDVNNPPEQREAARMRSQQLKEQFKFNLAHYVARVQALKKNIDTNTIFNPTRLGDRTLPIIKLILLRRGQLSEDCLSQRFRQQTQNQTYKDFKQSFLKYLSLVWSTPEIASSIAKFLSEKFKSLYLEHERDRINNALLLRTCKKLLDDLLFAEDRGTSPFLVELAQKAPLTLVRLLVKILLICPPSRTHLEYRIANLIQVYAQFPEPDCQYFTNFLEVLNIALAIYTENVKYNLIHMDSDDAENNTVINLNAYRVFAHYRGAIDNF